MTTVRIGSKFSINIPYILNLLTGPLVEELSKILLRKVTTEKKFIAPFDAPFEVF